MDTVGLNMEKAIATTSVFLPGESHGQQSLASYSPWVCKESDTPERLTHTHKQTGLKKIPQRTGKEKAPVNGYKVNMA